MYLGIDPGISGAITILNDGGSYEKSIRMPMKILNDNSAYKQWYDIDAISTLFKEYQNSTVALEYQRPIINRGIQKTSAGGQGAIAIFRTGRGFGILEALTEVFFDKVYIVDPNKWQNFLANKYLTKEEKVVLKEKDPNYKYLIDRIEHDAYKEWYSKYIAKKSLKKAKKKTAYIFYKIFKSMNYNIDINWKNNNIVDSFLLAKYIFDQCV